MARVSVVLRGVPGISVVLTEKRAQVLTHSALFSGRGETRNAAAVLSPDGVRQGAGGEAVRDGRPGGRKEVPAVRASPGDVEPARGRRQ